jgi:hypothetical protein
VEESALSVDGGHFPARRDETERGASEEAKHQSTKHQAQEAIRGWGWVRVGGTQGSGLDAHNFQLCRFVSHAER